MEMAEVARVVAAVIAVAGLCGLRSAQAAPALLWPQSDDPQAGWVLHRPAPEAAALTSLPPRPGLPHGVLRVTVRGAVTPPWQIQLSRAVGPAVAKGDYLRLRFRARSATRSRVMVILERASEPWTKWLSQPFLLTPRWQDYALVRVMPDALPADFAAVRFQLGFGAGEVDLADVELENHGQHPDPAPEPSNVDYYGGQPHSDAWRAAAEKRIERIRMGGLEVVVHDERGRPVKGATVTVEQQRHAFLFGTALADGPLLGDTPDARRYQETVARMFNYAVLENALKWPGKARFRESLADQMLDWCRDHDIPVRGHVLFWPSYRHLPPEAADLRGDALREAIREHIVDYVTHYRGKLVAWDVINEAVANHEITDDLGKGLLADCFRWAKAAAPETPLCYNDYGIVNNRAGANDGQRRAVRGILDYLIKEQRAPVDRIGIQAHMWTPLTPMDKVLQILDEFAAYGKPIEITEFDVGLDDDQAQASYLRDFMTAAFSHPAVISFVQWGFWEGSHWRHADQAHIIRRDWTPRPAAEAYNDLVFHRWWTRAQGTTGANGTWRTRAFLGRHLVTATAGGRTASAEVEVAKSGDAVTRVEVTMGESQE
jgi:endo-1,4-beta-xylanase